MFSWSILSHALSVTSLTWSGSWWIQSLFWGDWAWGGNALWMRCQSIIWHHAHTFTHSFALFGKDYWGTDRLKVYIGAIEGTGHQWYLICFMMVSGFSFNLIMVVIFWIWLPEISYLCIEPPFLTELHQLYIVLADSRSQRGAGPDIEDKKIKCLDVGNVLQWLPNYSTVIHVHIV